MVTQMIPIRFVDAQQLMSDLSPFRSDEARIIANQAGNSIVITDTQSNIKHLLEIIKAIDSCAEDVTEVEVFTLKNADATETAALLSSLFPDQNNNGGGGAPVRFGGRGGRGGGGFGGGFQGLAAAFGGGGNQGNALSQRVKKRQQVLAVADARTKSVVVTATGDLMPQIREMIDRLDANPGSPQRVATIKLDNADAQDVLPVLQDMFAGTPVGTTETTTTARCRVA